MGRSRWSTRDCVHRGGRVGSFIVVAINTSSVTAGGFLAMQRESMCRLRLVRP